LQIYIREGFDLSYKRCGLERKGFSSKIWSNIVPTVEEFKQTSDISCQVWIISDDNFRLNLDLLEEIKNTHTHTHIYIRILKERERGNNHHHICICMNNLNLFELLNASILIYFLVISSFIFLTKKN